MSIAAPGATPADQRFYRRTMRHLIGALAALAVVGGLAAGVPALAAGGTATTAVASRVAASGLPALAAIRRLAAGFGQTERAALSSTGLRLGALTSAERAEALAAVRALLSGEAWALVGGAMEADDALAAAGGGAGTDAWTLTLLEHETGAFFQLAGPELALNAIEEGGALLVEPELVQA
jgi:hypothetical protein